MSSRVLETVLTGRNLLSPMLATASRDVVAFNSTVATAQGKAATSAVTAAGVQDGAAAKIAASNAKASTSAVASANTQSRAYTRAAESATASSRVQQSANRALAASNGLLGTSLTPLTAGLGAVALGLGYAGYRGMEFGTAMSQVQAASQASAADMGRLKDAAIDAGAKTQYSAVEAAQGITEMSKAGVSAKDILGGGLTGALNLAAAGQISVAEAAETGATALSVFRLEGNQMSHVADLLAAGAGKAQGSVGDLSAALNQSALVASQTGLSIEDTAGALAMFASNGLIGSDAGTSFKTMLQALTPNSEAASKAMDAIGFSAYDAQGKFVGMESVADQLRTGLAGLTEEQRNTTLETIFGSDAVRAASVLYKEGARGVEEWTGKVDDAGFAARQAAELNDNLRGDLERLGGAVDSFFTQLGEGAQGPLRDIVQMFTGLVDAGASVLGFFSSLPGPLQTAIIAFGLVTAFRGPLEGLFRGVGFAADVFTAAIKNSSGPMDILKSAAGGLKSAFSPMTIGITAATVALPFLIESFGSLSGVTDRARAAQQTFADVLRETNGVINETSRAGAQKALIDAGFVDVLNAAGISSRDAIDGLLGNADAQDRVNHMLNEYLKLNPGTAHNAEAEGIRQAREGYKELAETLGMSKEEAEFFADAAVGAAGATAGMGAAAAGTVAQTEAATEAQNKLGESLAQFVEPLGAYTSLLEEKKEADRLAAEATAADTESSTDSWRDYVTDVTVSFEEYMARLEEQVTAQANWQSNMLALAGRVSQGTLDELARMGPEGAPLVADLVNRSDAELDHMDDLFAQRSTEATDAWGAQLTQASTVLAAVAGIAGQGVVDELAAKLAAGTTTVAAIAAQYGIELANGVNPVLTALGKPLIVNSPRRGNSYAADGAIHEEHSAEIAPGGAWRIWAEPETGGEAYIPLAASKRDRSMNIWRETGKLLGAPEAQYFGDGGFATAADVPKPRSTAPYGPPISTAADATMQKGFDEVRAWLNANASVGPTAGSGVQRWLPVVLQSLAMVGQPASLAQTVLRRMQQESGGNPTIVNRWDSNWARGTPSVGLMQVIGPTYRAYKDSRRDVGPYSYGTSVDPLSNILASEHYAISRYGSLSAAYNKAGGYDSGGLATSAGLLAKDTVQPERVLSPRQTEAFERWMQVAPAAMPGYGGTGGGGGGVAIDYDRLAAAVSKAGGTHIAVDASNRDHRAIARAIVAEQREQEWLSNP